MIKVGNKCILKKVGNNARHIKSDNLEDYLIEAEIVKIGRLYFDVEIVLYKNKEIIKFRKDDLSEHSDYSAKWEYYNSKQEVYDRVEKESIILYIRRYFDYMANKKDLSLDQLRAIKEILSK